MFNKSANMFMDYNFALTLAVVMEVEWIAIGISVVAIILAGTGISVGLLSVRRSAGSQPVTPLNLSNQHADGTWAAARQQSAREYFARFKEQIESATARGAVTDSVSLRNKYEWELQCWRSLESLRLLVQREFDSRAEGLREEESELLRQLVTEAVQLPDALMSDDDFFVLGNALYELGEFEEAVNEYSRCLRLKPSHAKALNNRAMCYFSLSQLQRAYRDCSEAIATRPGFAQAYTNRGLVNLNLGKNAEAVQDCGKAIRLDRRCPNSHIVRGLAYVNLGKHSRAVKDYNRAIQISPDSAEAYNNRGAAYIKLRQYQKAIQDYSQSIQMDPEFSLAYNNRGLAFFSLGQHERAIDDYSTAIKINPEFAQAYHNRGLAYFHMGQNHLAIQDYDAAKRLDPGQEAPESSELQPSLASRSIRPPQ